MSARYLADSLDLPANWQAERYSTTIKLIRDRKSGESNAFTAEVVLPYDNTPDNLAALKFEIATVVANNP